MSKKLRIVYMGTPEFACAGLESLINHNYNIVGVITAPDKKSGRGQKITTSPIKDLALKHELNILQPTNLKDPDFIEELKALNANLQIVVAFRMLPEIVWNMPSIGTFNLHASLLPQYRGAAPINWAIINGEKETGVTTFFLKHKIDTGDIIFQEKTKILPEDNVGSLYNKLMNQGADVILKTVESIAQENYTLQVQKETEDLKEAPKIFKETCEINWHKPADEIHNFVRGLSPYPVAWTKLKDKTCKLFETITTDIPSKDIPGSFESDGKTYLRFNTTDCQVEVKKIQLQGKRQMDITDFLRGYQF